ncbi:hypothetical protein AB0F07_18100 [Streptomyces fructofermentans]|uniref:WapI family immunity protein n=1 Tax=Streptomyces fructofermentans TaxID=152141 RepID=UPI0033FA651C
MDPDTWFVEPVLAFSLAGRHEDGVAVRVHFSLEAAPPWARAGRTDKAGGPAEGEGTDGTTRTGIYQFFVTVRVATSALLDAAEQWELAMTAFPRR